MKRPTVVTVFAILNIVFGVFGLGGAIISAIVLPMLPDADKNPALKIMHDSPAFSLWMKIALVLGVLGSIALIAAGIGLLQMKPWGRLLSIAYGVYAILLAIVSGIMNYKFLVAPLLQEAQNKQGPEAAGAIGGAFGGVIGGCISLIYPVLLIIFMTRPKVVTAFDPSRASYGDEYENRYDDGGNR